VLDACPSTQPTLTTDHSSVTLTWPDRGERLDLDTGKTLPPSKDLDGAPGGTVIARTSRLTANESRKTLHTSPFRWGAHVTVIALRDTATNGVRAQVVSDQPLRVLRLDEDAVVVRDGGQVIRYTVDDKG
jgi:hypothetical protein